MGRPGFLQDSGDCTPWVFITALGPALSFKLQTRSQGDPDICCFKGTLHPEGLTELRKFPVVIPVLSS